jgi:hypothetical protein
MYKWHTKHHVLTFSNHSGGFHELQLVQNFHCIDYGIDVLFILNKWQFALK